MSTEDITEAGRGIVCLYFGNAEECQGCGGWTKAEGGPFGGDSRFCSEECFEDAMELASRIAQRAAAAWCPACGYDRGEHAPDCSGKYPPCSGRCGCRLGTDDADRSECGCDGGCCE